MKRFIATATAGALLAIGAAPAYAINDPVAPGDDCSASGSQAIGHPAFVHLTADPPPVGVPASVDNPGQSTGAKGMANSQATGHCANA